MTNKRASGILLHITSLPSKYGVGDLGPEAYKFVDFLAKAKQSFWQILPLNLPAFKPATYSPYNCCSAFAGNTLLVSPDLLYRQGLLTKRDIRDIPSFPQTYVNYQKAVSYKTVLLNAAYANFKASGATEDYKQFCKENGNWLEDFSLFSVLARRFRNQLWCDWPRELRDRNKYAIVSAEASLRRSIEREKFLQYLFFKQWFSLRDYCSRKGVKIIGDVPIYVAFDSADVWANPEIFRLTALKKPRFVGGVPPDLFSRTGQLWGNPVYNWRVLKKTRYRWWLERIRHNLNLFDIVRIDHFRGFFEYWQVPAGSKNAVNGKWVEGPGEDFFRILFKHFPVRRIIAEDLGYITPYIRSFIKKAHIAGTRVLLFGFGGNPSTNFHFPDNYVKNSVVYTSTHDSNTMKGWFEKEADIKQKDRLVGYLGRRAIADRIHWELINLAAGSVANLVIIPVQDILGLDENSRMNRPGTNKGNWLWRLRPGQITSGHLLKLAHLTKVHKRA